MTKVAGSGINSKAIICLEGSEQIWRMVQAAVDGSSEFICARSGESSAEIVRLCQRLAPTLLVIEDIRIQTLPFKQLRDLIHRRHVQILAFSDATDYASYEDFFRLGCAGILPYGATVPSLKRAILAIRDEELWFPRKVLSKLAQEAFLRSSLRKVTQRESEIFKLVCLGFTNQQIAEHLFISRETVRWHLRGLYSKIGVETRAAAIRYARECEYESSAPGSPLSPDTPT